ncbi:Zn-dependent membrane protease YugP [Bacilli bacterium PM5-3]|nr:Zn-dependent membrane protease YugP [Bacilli bacterium PM5-3]MDH6603758.1 Zn-dependent membrane protease YugP [Bacilli bacterium PM5-9]
MYGYGGSDSFYWALVLIPIILIFLVQGLLQSNYKKYSKMQNHRGLSGYEVARRILDSNGLSNVEIFEGSGQLSDYFDPTKNIIKLSPEVYGGRSIASLAIAAHEVGHAIQYATKYPVIAFRNKLLPLTITASNFAWIIIFLGIFLTRSNNFLLYLGIGLMLVVALFQLVTLPLEFNASSRALKNLEDGNYLDYDEIPKAKKVLNSAAMTYVVALITTLAEILRLVLISNRRN